jgi:hypothetical protein
VLAGFECVRAVVTIPLREVKDPAVVPRRSGIRRRDGASVCAVNRGPYLLVMQPPHSAAAVVEITGGDRCAVDTWFGNNGELAIEVPDPVWSRGYRPPFAPSTGR